MALQTMTTLAHLATTRDAEAGAVGGAVAGAAVAPDAWPVWAKACFTLLLTLGPLVVGAWQREREATRAERERELQRAHERAMQQQGNR